MSCREEDYRLHMYICNLIEYGLYIKYTSIQRKQINRNAARNGYVYAQTFLN